MEEPLFADVEEKPNVAKKQKPSDYEDMPVIDTVDFINPSEIPINERPIATVSLSNRQKNQELSSFQKSLRKNCPCGMSFGRKIDLINHEAAFKGRPHVFCKPCDKVILKAAFRAHQVYYHTATGSLQPRCTICLKKFPNWIDLANHEAFFKGRPHTFCKLCDLVVTEDHNAHRKSKHAAVTTQTTGYPQNQVSFVHQEPQESTEVQILEPISAGSRGEQETPRFVIQPWEKAAGAQKAEDILLGLEPERWEKKEEGRKRRYPGYEEVTVLYDGKKEETPLNQPRAMTVVGRKRKCQATFPRLFYEKEDDSIGPKHRYPCPVRECSHGFLVFEDLAEHMSQEHPGLHPLWCQLCPASFDTTLKFWQHMERQHGVFRPRNNPEGYSCDDCGRRYVREKLYYDHRRQWLGRTHSFCCTRTDDWKTHLESKEHKMSTDLSLPWKCRIDGCGFAFKTEMILIDHMAAHPGQLAFACSLCFQKFWFKANLQHHLEQVHNSSL